MADTIQLQPITAEAFAPFGRVIQQGAIGQPGPEMIDELVSTRASARPRLGFAAVPSTALPFAAVTMERHVHSAQAFVPTACAAYMVMVAPKDPAGQPDRSKLRAFRVPGAMGILYRADVWHHAIASLDGDGRFAVLTFVDGSAADQDVVRLEPPVTITA